MFDWTHTHVLDMFNAALAVRETRLAPNLPFRYSHFSITLLCIACGGLSSEIILICLANNSSKRSCVGQGGGGGKHVRDFQI